MAAEWTEVSIDDIASRIAMGPFGSDIKTDNFVPIGVPVIRGSNLTCGRFRSEDFVFLSEEKADELANANAFSGDLVFTHRGTLGQVGLVPTGPYPRYVVSQSQMKLTCDPEKADPQFMYYFFKSPIGQHELLANTSQTGVPAISRPVTSLKAIRVLLPSLAEQRSIGSTLGALDDKIELNRRTSETLEQMARALFKSWFVDFDPVRAKAEGRDTGLPKPIADLFPDAFQDTDLGEIPSGWRRMPLTKIASYQNGAACQKFAASDGEPSLPVIKIRELNQGVTEQSDRAKLDVPQKHKCVDGDVLFSWSGTLVCKVWTGGAGFVNQHLFKVTSDTFPRWFYLWWTRHYLEQFQGIAADKATTMGHIKRDDLDRATALVPGTELLAWMNGIMEPLVERSLQTELESRTLAALRDTLLPKLISGEVRVPTIGGD